MIYIAKLLVFIGKWLYRIFIGPLFIPFLLCAFIINFLTVIIYNLNEFSKKDKEEPSYDWDFGFCAFILFALMFLRIDIADKYI